MQTADRRLGKKLQTRYKMQTADKMQTDNLYCFRVIDDNMSSYNLPSVMLFRDHPSQLFVLLWNIPCPFLDQNHS